MFGKKQKENQNDDNNGEAESESSFSIIPETKTEDNKESGFSIKRSEIADKETENLHEFNIIPDSNSEEPEEKKKGLFRKRDKDVEKVGDIEERTDFEIKPEKEKKKGKRFGKKSKEETEKGSEEEQSPRGRRKKGLLGLKGRDKKSKGGILSGRKKYDNPEDDGEYDEEDEFHSLPEYDYRENGPLVFPKHDPGDTILESYWIEPGLSRVSIVRTQDYENVYITHEPALTEFEKYLLERLHSGVRDLLIIKEIRVEDKVKTLYEAIDILIESYKLDEEIEPETIYKIRYYLKRSFFGWGRIDPLRGDTEIEDISCDGYDSHVFLYHRKYRDMRTIIKFKDPRELDSLVALFAQKSGKHISLANPIVDATLPEGSRIQLTYGTVVGSHGSSFTIRKFKKNPFSPIDLIINGTFTVEEIVYMWMAVENNHSVLIIGGTASGKTTTLNAMAQFIPALSKVVTIEDTREINLDHENWIASIVPPSSSSLEESKHDITMFDLLKAAMRQRPEYILVGEVRGVETQTLFQAMNTGHTTFSTLHAGDVVAAINRLQNPPLDVPKATIETLDVVISQARMFRNGKQVRRCNEIVEIVGLTETGDLEINQVYTYNPDTDKPVFSGFSDIYAKIAKKTNRNKSDFDEEIDVRKTIISSMLRQEIHDYREVARIVWLYLSRRDYVIENIDNLMPLLKKNEGNAEPETQKSEKREENDNSDINKYYQNLVEEGKAAEAEERTSVVTPVIIEEGNSEPEEVSKETKPEESKEDVHEISESDSNMAYRFNEDTGRWETTAPKVIQETDYDSETVKEEEIPEIIEPEVEEETEKVEEEIPDNIEPEVTEEPEKIEEAITEIVEPEVVEEPEKVEEEIPENIEPEVEEETEIVEEVIPEIIEPEVVEEPEKVEEIIPENIEPEVEDEPEKVEEEITENIEPEAEEEPEIVEEEIPETIEPEAEEEPEIVEEVIPEIIEPEVVEKPNKVDEIIPENIEPEVTEEPVKIEEAITENIEPEVEEETEKIEEVIPETIEPEVEEETEIVEEAITEIIEPKAEEEPEIVEEKVPEIVEPEVEDEPEKVEEEIPETKEPIKETPKPQPKEEEYSIYDDPSAFEEEEPEPVKEIPKEELKVEEKVIEEPETIQEPEEETDELFEIEVPLPSDEDRYGIKSETKVHETTDDDFFEIGGNSEKKNYGSTFDLYADESDDSSKK